MQKKLIPILVALALGTSSAYAAEDRATVNEEATKSVVAKTLDQAGKIADDLVTSVKKTLTGEEKKTDDATSVSLEDEKINIADAPSKAKGDAKEENKSTLQPLKSISKRTIERKRDYQRPDAAAAMVRNDGTPATKPIPSVPASYLRGENQNEQNLNILKSQASTPVQKAKTSTASTPVKLNNDTRIPMMPGENVYIPISKDHPNRLITPFTNPQVISTTLSGGKKKGECGEVCVRDGIIYITTSSSTAVTAFITQKDNEEIAFSVTMLPRAIPPREVHFTLPQSIVDKVNTKKGARALSSAEGWEQAQPYVDTLRGSLRQVALQEIPPGYSLRAVRRSDPLPRCKHPGLNIDFANGQIMEGFNLDIYVGVAENVANVPVEFKEQTCGGWRIAAVTSWPLKVLKPGQKTEVYVITKKDEEVQSDQVRKPLITRQYQ